MTPQPPAVGRVGEGQPSRRRALIPRDCWTAAWHSATTVGGVLALALAVLAVIAATEPWGVWLLNVSQGVH